MLSNKKFQFNCFAISRVEMCVPLAPGICLSYVHGVPPISAVNIKRFGNYKETYPVFYILHYRFLVFFKGLVP